MGREALQTHAELMAEFGEALPEPTSLEAVSADPANAGGAVSASGLPSTARHAARYEFVVQRRRVHDGNLEANR